MSSDKIKFVFVLCFKELRVTVSNNLSKERNMQSWIYPNESTIFFLTKYLNCLGWKFILKDYTNVLINEQNIRDIDTIKNCNIVVLRVEQ